WMAPDTPKPGRLRGGSAHTTFPVREPCRRASRRAVLSRRQGVQPMTTIQLPFPREWSVDDLIRHLAVPASRIRLTPPPGTAVEDDVLRIQREEGRLCELIDGVLVEKPMGYQES